MRLCLQKLMHWVQKIPNVHVLPHCAMEMRCPQTDLWQADSLASYPRLPKMDISPTEPTSGVAENNEDSKPPTLLPYYLFTVP